MNTRRLLHLSIMATLAFSGSADAQTLSTPWYRGGNTLTGANTPALDLNALGTFHDAPVTLYTNSVERMRINQIGNVGIGTTGPGIFPTNFLNGRILHLKTETSNARFVIETGAGTIGNPGILFRQSSGAADQKMAGFFLTGGSLQLHSLMDNLDSRTPFLLTANLVTGNIGIGVNSATAKLDVVTLPGDLAWTVANWRKGISLSDGSVLKWKPNVVGHTHGIGQSDVGLYFISSTADDQSAAANYNMFISNTGRVGVGSVEPSAKLEIVTKPTDLAWTTANWRKGINLSNTSVLKWRFTPGGFTHGIGQSDAGLYFISSTVEDQAAAPVYNMFISNTGRVGAGILTPGARFHAFSNDQLLPGMIVQTVNSDPYGYNFISRVNNSLTNAISVELNGSTNFKVYGSGAVYARSVNVQLGNFPDYVFSKDYKLRSLQEVEQYIQENRHLPGIPTASEVESQGADLGGLVKLQMEKIEELTLYIIEQDKRIRQLEEKTAAKK
jgi:hypothetical protein